MNFREYIEHFMTKKKIARKDLAARLRIPGYALTRALSKDPGKFTVGELETFAEALDQRFVATMYPAWEVTQAIHQNAQNHNTIHGRPPQHLVYAIELSLLDKMEDLHPLEIHTFSRNGKQIQLMGWHLGRALANPGQNVDNEDLAEVYWCRSIHNLDFMADEPGRIFFWKDEWCDLMTLNHAQVRLPIDYPTDAGRTYSQLESQFAYRDLTAFGHIIIDHTFEEPQSYLSVGPISPDHGTEPYDYFHAAVPGATEPWTSERPTSTLAERIEMIHSAFEIPSNARIQDLQGVGIRIPTKATAQQYQQALMDSTEPALRRLAAQYRLAAPWVLEGKGTPTPISTLPSHGWYGLEILLEVCKSIQNNTLLATYLLLFKTNEWVTAKLVLEKRHPQIKNASIYEHVSEMQWNSSHQRVPLKAVLKFLMHTGHSPMVISLPAEVKKRFQDGLLMVPQLINHPDGQQISFNKLILEHDGWQDAEQSSGPVRLDVNHFFAEYDGPVLLGRLSELKPNP